MNFIHKKKIEQLPDLGFVEIGKLPIGYWESSSCIVVSTMEDSPYYRSLLENSESIFYQYHETMKDLSSNKQEMSWGDFLKLKDDISLNGFKASAGEPDIFIIFERGQADGHHRLAILAYLFGLKTIVEVIYGSIIFPIRDICALKGPTKEHFESIEMPFVNALKMRQQAVLQSIESSKAYWLLHEHYKNLEAQHISSRAEIALLSECQALQFEACGAATQLKALVDAIKHRRRPLWERLLFRRSGKPKKLFRRFLFHSNGEPREIFRKWILLPNGHPRVAFYMWMSGQEYQNLKGNPPRN